MRLKKCEERKLRERLKIVWTALPAPERRANENNFDVFFARWGPINRRRTAGPVRINTHAKGPRLIKRGAST